MWPWPRDPYPFARRVVLVTKGSESENRTLRGILWEQRGGFVVLKRAELLEPRGVVRPLDGDTLVDRVNVHYIQVIGPEEP